MTQKNLSLQKAVELRMEPISQNRDNKFYMGSIKRWLFKLGRENS